MIQSLKTEKNIFSKEEYFELEEQAEFKSEYYYGKIFAMSGASATKTCLSFSL